MRRARFLPFALAAALAACSDSGAPDTGGVKPPSALTIIRLPAASQPILNPVQSETCTKGVECELNIFFTDPLGGAGDGYLRLRVHAASLLKHPDGSLFQVGETVLITVSVVDPTQIYFEFQPSGLTFDPAVPAQLRIEYGETGDDLDDDGDVDPQDAAIEQVIAIWRQEQPGQSFLRLSGVKSESLDEIEADVLGFTRYAIAY